MSQERSRKYVKQIPEKRHTEAVARHWGREYKHGVAASQGSQEAQKLEELKSDSPLEPYIEIWSGHVWCQHINFWFLISSHDKMNICFNPSMFWRFVITAKARIGKKLFLVWDSERTQRGEHKSSTLALTRLLTLPVSASNQAWRARRCISWFSPKPSWVTQVNNSWSPM